MRKAREKSSTGIYHVWLRGAPGIFSDEEDREYMVKRIKESEARGICKFFAWAISEDSMMMLVKEVNRHIGEVAKFFSLPYSSYYRKMYGNVGLVFVDRYKSESVETASYLKRVRESFMQDTPLARFVAAELPDLPDDGHQDDKPLMTIPVRPKRVNKTVLLAFLKSQGYTTPEEFQKMDKSRQKEIILAAKKLGASTISLSTLTGYGKNYANKLARRAGIGEGRE